MAYAKTLYAVAFACLITTNTVVSAQDMGPSAVRSRIGSGLATGTISPMEHPLGTIGSNIFTRGSIMSGMNVTELSAIAQTNYGGSGSAQFQGNVSGTFPIQYVQVFIPETAQRAYARIYP